MGTVTTEFSVKVEIVSRQCLKSGIDPINVLSKAIEEKIRMDGLVQDVLGEDEHSFSANNREGILWTE